MSNVTTTPRQAANLGYVLGGISVLIVFLVGVFNLPIATRSDVKNVQDQAIQHRLSDDYRFTSIEERMRYLERRQDELVKWQTIMREKLGVGEGSGGRRSSGP